MGYKYWPSCGRKSNISACSSLMHLVCFLATRTTDDTGAFVLGLVTFIQNVVREDAGELTVIPHSHREQQRARTSRWLCLKPHLGVKYFPSPRQAEGEHLRQRRNWSFLKNHLSGECLYEIPLRYTARRWQEFGLNAVTASRFQAAGENSQARLGWFQPVQPDLRQTRHSTV